MGTVLVDNAGKTLYLTDSDLGGTIKCTGERTKLRIPAAAPSSGPEGADLGVGGGGYEGGGGYGGC